MRSFLILLLFLAGCGSGTSPERDKDAAREFIRKSYPSPRIILTHDLVEEPEYADIPKIPRDHLAAWAEDRAAACGVRVKFTWKEGSRTTKDEWIVWVNRDHQAVGWSTNENGDNWRQFVQAAARK